MFDAERMAKMKDGAILLNVGRGMIVDTDALCAALENGKLAGAGVDVTDPEPLPQITAVEDGKCGHHTAYLRRIPFAGDARPHCVYYGGEFKAFSGG